MKIYSYLWIAWIAMFFAIELTALFTGKPQYTLSEFTWRAEELGHPWDFARFFIAAGCIWLSMHLVFGWWR